MTFSMFTPDDFATDAYGWLTNQTGHVVLGLVLTALLAAILRAIVDADMRWPALMFVAVVYCVAWEIGWQAIGKGWRDAVEDTAFVTLGGIIGVTAWGRKGGELTVALLTMAGIMAAGVARRWKR